MRRWLYWHFPIITTRCRQDKECYAFINAAESRLHTMYKNFFKFKDKSAWAAINPVISSLKELRKNTWDKDRVDHAIKWLTDNFEVKDDNTRYNP